MLKIENYEALSDHAKELFPRKRSPKSLRELNNHFYWPIPIMILSIHNSLLEL